MAASTRDVTRGSNAVGVLRRCGLSAFATRRKNMQGKHAKVSLGRLFAHSGRLCCSFGRSFVGIRQNKRHTAFGRSTSITQRRTCILHAVRRQEVGHGHVPGQKSQHRAKLIELPLASSSGRIPNCGLRQMRQQDPDTVWGYT